MRNLIESIGECIAEAKGRGDGLDDEQQPLEEAFDESKFGKNPEEMDKMFQLIIQRFEATPGHKRKQDDIQPSKKAKKMVDKILQTMEYLESDLRVMGDKNPALKKMGDNLEKIENKMHMEMINNRRGTWPWLIHKDDWLKYYRAVVRMYKTYKKAMPNLTPLDF